MFRPPVQPPLPTPLPPRPRRARVLAAAGRLRPVALFAVGVAAALVAVALFNVAEPAPAPITGGDVDQAIASALASQTPGPALSEAAYAAIRPSLVLIRTQSPAPPGGTAGSGLGSGVIVDTAGDILTSLHVVADATAIQVTFADGTHVAGPGRARESRPRTSRSCRPISLPRDRDPGHARQPQRRASRQRCLRRGQPLRPDRLAQRGGRLRPSAATSRSRPAGRCCTA